MGIERFREGGREDLYLSEDDVKLSFFALFSIRIVTIGASETFIVASLFAFIFLTFAYVLPAFFDSGSGEISNY